MKMLNQNNKINYRFYQVVATIVLMTTICCLGETNKVVGLRSLLKKAIQKQTTIPEGSKIYYLHFSTISQQLVQSQMIVDTNDTKMYISKSRVLLISPKLISLQTDSVLYTIVPPKSMISVMVYNKDYLIKINVQKQLEFYNKILDDSTGTFDYTVDSLSNEVFVNCKVHSPLPSCDTIKLNFRLYDDDILSTEVIYLLKGEIIASMFSKTLEVNRNYQFKTLNPDSQIFFIESLNQITFMNEFKDFEVRDSRKIK